MPALTGLSTRHTSWRICSWFFTEQITRVQTTTSMEPVATWRMFSPAAIRRAQTAGVSLGNALDQELLKAGVGINTGHLASRGVELEVGPCATAQLQQGELPRGASELPQVAEELLLLALHLFVVHHSEPRQEVGEPLFAYPVPQAQKVQQVHGKCQDADGQTEDKNGERHHSEKEKTDQRTEV